MNRRIQSVQLMKLLQPFLQGGVLCAKNAKEIVDEYVSGNDAPLHNLITSPSLPMAYKNVAKQLNNFIQ